MTSEELVAVGSQGIERGDVITDPRSELVARCEAAGLPLRFHTHELDDDDEWSLEFATIEYPVGDERRKVVLDESKWPTLIALPFETVQFLGDFAAILHSDGTIEAALRNGRAIHDLRDLPGAEPTERGELEPGEDRIRPPWFSPWRLRVPDPDSAVVVEIGSISLLADLLTPGSTSFRIEGSGTRDLDKCLALLERLSGEFSFELDARYGVSFQLTRRTMARRSERVDKPDSRPNFPKNDYPLEALKLYNYGRDSVGLPLLEYLALYQSIEYYFPFFANEDAVKVVRRAILHPRFDPHDDEKITALVEQAGRGTRGYSEVDQIRATVSACITKEELRAFLRRDTASEKFFSANKQAIAGVEKVLFSSGADLREQIADRIYRIRCRIVHSKLDGGGNAKVLLPGTAEARALSHDLDLVRFVAQQVIIARAART